MNGFLEIIAVNTAVTTVLALLVAVATRFVRRAPVVYALWTLVLLKLLVPPLINIPVEVNSELLHFAFSETSSETSGSGALPRDDNATDSLGMASAAGLPDLPQSATYTATSELASDFAEVSSRDVERTAATQPSETGPRSPIISGQLLLTLILFAWGLGSLLWVAYFVRHMRTFRKLLKHAQPASETLQSEGASLAAHYGLRRCPEIRIVDGGISPLVWPAWRGPIVLVPADLVARLDATQQRTLIAHELAHVRRGDHLWRWLHLATLAAYWWHPVAWWSVRRIQQAEEQCCDAWVVWALENSRRQYAQTLLDTIDFLSPPAARSLLRRAASVDLCL